MKRKQSPTETDDGYEEAATPEQSASTNSKRRNAGPDKVAKKSARMERNRQAAQVSRDRKKHYVEDLEAKVADLESRPVDQTPSAAPDDSRVTALEAENASLRTQLAEEASFRQTLQTRLDDLEGQMKTLSSFLQASTAPSVSATPPSTAFQAISPLALSGSSSAAGFGLTGPHSLVAADGDPLGRAGSPPFDLQADFQHTWDTAQWAHQLDAPLFQAPPAPAFDLAAYLEPGHQYAAQDAFLSDGLLA